MDRHQTPTQAFEVWCNTCQTSFAAGTKRCIHCGERLSKQRSRRSRARLSARIEDQVALPPEIDDVLVEDQEPQKKPGLSPMTAVWIAIFVGGYLFQLCARS